MAITASVATIWASSILAGLERNAVGGACVNRNYEGEIRQKGDSVKVTEVADVTIGDYVSGTDITIERAGDTAQTLSITEQKYFGVEVDRIENVQTAATGFVAAVADKATIGLKNTLDQFIFTTMAAGVAAGNAVAEATISTASDAYDAMVAWSVLLDEADVPEEGRWTVVSPAFHGLLLKDSRFVSAGDATGAATRLNGRVGEAAGFEVMKSNNLTSGATTGTVMLAGYRGATTLAEQISEFDIVDKEKGFASIVKGLHVYGAKVLRPTGLVSADIIVS